MPNPTIDQLRSYAVSRTLFSASLPRAVERLGFVQADPIRAPARAQDLTLRHRVAGYRAGDLERRYHLLDVEEDYFINYGFLPRATHRLLHPRTATKAWTSKRWALAREVLEYVRDRGVVHPRDVNAHFQHGRTKNWFGGTSNASTQLLDGMHYRGLLRVARREGGIRLYSAADWREEATARDGSASRSIEAAMDRMVDVIVAKYAPLPASSLRSLVSRLGLALL